MKRAYIRCNSGHYFSGGPNCPLDNWSSPQSREFAQAVEQLTQEGQEVSIQGLRDRGLSDEALRQIIVVDFGSVRSAFTCLVLEGYVLDDGRYVPITKAGWDFI
jgi:hypothetical protein